ncbi:sigma-70 family RNA polymerase sigma factor [Streptomyces sp. NPDC051555]|uniref:sigma-70 family RNA polymerase sigma factor n=1 Tax=Streptomyces sp. NPDC051555 TaxID=3365657 RepID=UPI00378BAB8D
MATNHRGRTATTTVRRAPATSHRAHLLFRRLAEDDAADRASVRDELIIMHLPLVRCVAYRRSRPPEHDVEELCQTGAIGLIKAVDRFDYRLKTPFAAFALVYIDGEIKRFFRDTAWAAHVPRTVKDRAVAVTRTARQLTASLDHEATAEEIAHELGLRREEVVQAVAATRAWQARPLDPPSPRAGTGFDKPDPAAAAAYDSVDNSQLVAHATGRLSPRERQVIDLRFRQEMSQDQIGILLGVTQPQVSRMLSRSLRKMRESLE